MKEGRQRSGRDRGRRRGRERKEGPGGRGKGGGRTGVILHSSGVCLAESAGGRAEDYGITARVAGHVSLWSTLTLLTASQ